MVMKMINKETAETAEKGDMVLRIEEFTESNNRIDGLRRLASIAAPISSPVFVIPHESFVAYRQDPIQAIEQLDKQIQQPAQEAMAQSKKRSIALRRAYVVPDLANPPGPNYLGVTDKTIAEHVKKFFDFAIEQGYDKEGSQIACFFYPFVDPENKPLAEIKRHDVLPYGGHIIPSLSDPSRFEILATWGNHQTLFLYEREGKPVESYDITMDLDNPERIKIEKKNIVQKDAMHYTNRAGRNTIVPVPKSHQLQQVMYDSEIIEVTKHAARLVQEFGPQRLEFSFDGENFFFNEAVEISREVGIETPDYSAQGEVFIVTSRKDIDRLAGVAPEDLEKMIINVADRERGDITYGELAERFQNTPLTILYEGTSRTAHIMRIFQDKGHFPFAIGTQDLRENDVVAVSSKDGVVEFENLTISGVSEVTPLYLAHKKGIENVGGKAERLSYLKLKGFDVPDGVVNTADFFDELLKSTGADELLAELVFNHVPAQQIERQMQEKIVQIPDPLWEKVSGIHDRYGLFSVIAIARSSANVEDVRGGSYAGVFESYPFLKGEKAVREGILKCILSTFAAKVLSNVGEENLDDLMGIKMAVLVEQMVDARVSGTLFGKDPQTGSEKIVTVEAKRGFGQEIVEGHGAEQRLVYRKNDRSRRVSEGQSVLTEAEIEYLLDLSEILEDRFRFPQDNEWAIDKSGKFWILQSRDL